jgi:uncharacterized protein (TIGR02598 family)
MAQAHCRRIRSLSGFSLIEVTLALGVMAFAVVAIMGLLAIGLTSSQRSTSTTAAARLAAEVQSELQQVGLASFFVGDTSFNVEGRIASYYDNGGNLVLVYDGQGKPISQVYDVCRTVLNCNLPGATTSPLKRVVVQVLNNPGRQPLLRNPSSGLVNVPSGMEELTFEFHVVAP